MSLPPYRIVFMGTPEFAGPTLSALVNSGEDVRLVVTPPDRPKGRGRKPAPPPVKVLAQELGLELWQPESVKAPEVNSRIRDLSPDLLVVVAFGGILPQELLDAPKIGPLNLHPSLLPAYRGPAPINWAVINGDRVTGVTTMFMNSGVDTGPILLSEPVAIEPEETAGHLHDRLARIGAELIVKTIAGLKSGDVTPTPQPTTGASLARMLIKADGLIDWTRPAAEIATRIRGLDPWPGAFTTYKGQILKLYGAKADAGRGEPGRVLALSDERLHVAAADGSVAIAELQLAGKKRVAAKDFWHGQRLSPSVFFGSS